MKAYAIEVKYNSMLTIMQLYVISHIGINVYYQCWYNLLIQHSVKGITELKVVITSVKMQNSFASVEKWRKQ